MLGKGVDILLSVSVLFILFLVNEHQLRPSKNRREQKENKEEDTPTGHRTKKGRQEKTEDYQPWKQVLEVGFCLLLSSILFLFRLHQIPQACPFLTDKFQIEKERKRFGVC